MACRRTKLMVYQHTCRFTAVVLLMLLPFCVAAQYNLYVKGVDKDSVFIKNRLGVETNFKSQLQAREYVNKLPEFLQIKGYPAASVDSVRFDSLHALIHLYVGEAFKWAYINTDSVDKRLLAAVAWNNRQYRQNPLNANQLQSTQQKMLEYLENNGYPFANITLDSLRFEDEKLYARLVVDRGPLYKIDSVRNLGNARISNGFLQRYLELPEGTVYKKEKLEDISKKLKELPYATEQRPWDLTMLGTGSILNVYLAPKKSSQVNVLVGLLPANQQLESNKLLVTGEATINLRNALGSGETIGINWQQIQVKSPRLNLLYQQPYLFNSPFGVNFAFDLFKKDSSFINISMMIGAQYAVSSGQTGSVFIQNLTTNLLTVDTFFIKNNRRLPDEADINTVNLGVSYELNTTDYRFNPRSGNELMISSSAGIKNIKRNNVVGKLVDQSDPSFNFNSLYDTMQLRSYQFRIKLMAAHYFPLTRVSTIRASLNGGWVQSPVLFRNELFQIGGYRLLRGFDEESIFASQYAATSAEYRYFLGQNSFLFSFVDFGWVKNKSRSNNVDNTFLGAGLGMAFETRAGIFNISYAAGKRDDTRFNLRQSKIHLGYVNYF
jgi:outer membrane protein assembly factor BamA